MKKLLLFAAFIIVLLAALALGMYRLAEDQVQEVKTTDTSPLRLKIGNADGSGIERPGNPQSAVIPRGGNVSNVRYIENIDSLHY